MDGLSARLYFYWPCLAQRQWDAWTISTMNIMQRCMRPLVQWHGVLCPLGSFTLRTSATTVISRIFVQICSSISKKAFFAAIFSDLLSWRGFLISTRLSYAVYLTQFPLFFYNVGTTRHSGYYHFITSTVIHILTSHHCDRTIENISLLDKSVRVLGCDNCICGINIVLRHSLSKHKEIHFPKDARPNGRKMC